jgi:hypothetical protein
VVVLERVRACTVPLQVERVTEGVVTGDCHTARPLNRDSCRIPECSIGLDRRPVRTREIEDPERPVVDRPIVEDDVVRGRQSDADPPVVVDRSVVTDQVVG